MAYILSERVVFCIVKIIIYLFFSDLPVAAEDVYMGMIGSRLAMDSRQQMGNCAMDEVIDLHNNSSNLHVVSKVRLQFCDDFLIFDVEDFHLAFSCISKSSTRFIEAKGMFLKTTSGPKLSVI